MSVAPAPLPLGIRMNNPGNLRRAVGLAKPAVKENGFVKFDTLSEGVFSLCKLMEQYYTHLGHRTLRQIVQAYAPPTENDTMRYETSLAAFARLNPLRAETNDLHLDRAWNALAVMRGIVWIENGNPPPSWRTQPEWVGLHDWVYAMDAIALWKGQL